jgi:glycosyltransferase involved in cell wall biosynthesis
MASTGSNSSPDSAEVEASTADVVVGLASYNNAATIGEVAAAVRTGLTTHFTPSQSVVVLADGGSTDGTLDRVRQVLDGSVRLGEVTYPLATTEVLSPAYHGLPGRSNALHAILQAAGALNAQACAVVDASVMSVTPDWIERLVQPVLRGGFDLAAAYYPRHPFDGALTKSIVYPVFRALFGLRLRQPAAGDFGCSSRLLQHYLSRWTPDGPEVGVDIWISAAAACGGFQVCEAAVGERRSEARGDAPDLSTTLAQVVGSLFAELERRVEFWQRVRSSADVPVCGDIAHVAVDGPPLDAAALADSFSLGYRELRDVWASVLPPAAIVALKKLAERSTILRLDDRLWARIVYDFALGYRLRTLPRDHLLRALTPLYLGWLASFILQVPSADPDETDRRVEEVCLAFEAEKPYLIARWRWPEQFRT